MFEKMGKGVEPLSFHGPVFVGIISEAFGLPTYTSIWVNATAIKMACKAGHGKTTRKAVRKDLLKVKLTAKKSVLGFPVQFLNKNKGTFQGPGDMGGSADFAIYHITNSGTYVRVK